MAKKLADIPLNGAYRTQQKAILRMHLYVVGETHRMLLDTATAMRNVVLAGADASGKIDGLGLYHIKRELTAEWDRFMKKWKPFFEEMRRQAASIPFGTMAVYHQKFLRPAMEGLTEAVGSVDSVFTPQLEALVKASNQRIYRDGLNISERIWKLDRDSLREIENIIATGVANGASAWDTAEALEQYLGAGQDCPRWTRTRLYKISKKEIAAGRRTGLYSKDACAGQGVAYKALRLARNEIQAIHHMATDAMMKQMPWVQKEQIHLSAAHPVDDECDVVVGGGDDGAGIYAVGTVELPLHTQCLCYKTAVLMSEDEFTESLRAWTNGTQAWPEMDDFEQSIGGNILVNLARSQIAQHLTQWAFEDPYKFN